MLAGGGLEAELHPRAEKQEPFRQLVCSVLCWKLPKLRAGEGHMRSTPPWLGLGMSLGIKALSVLLSCSASNLWAPGPCESAPRVSSALQVRLHLPQSRNTHLGFNFEGDFVSDFSFISLFIEAVLNSHM